MHRFHVGGYWVIGMRGAGDVAMYPMIKVLDCAGDPTNIDGDSEWFRQECFECAEEQGIGDVREAGRERERQTL